MRELYLIYLSIVLAYHLKFINNISDKNNTTRVLRLIPGTTQDLDKKSFSWTVKELSGTSFDFDFTFDNPEYISMGDRADYMNVKFHNTDVYMVPKDSDKAAVPDGY